MAHSCPGVQVHGDQVTHTATKFSDASVISPQAFSFEGTANRQLPACPSTDGFVLRRAAPAAVTVTVALVPSGCPTTDGFELRQAAPAAVALVPSRETVPEQPPDLGAVGTKEAAVLEVRAELATPADTVTPPGAAAIVMRRR